MRDLSYAVLHATTSLAAGAPNVQFPFELQFYVSCNSDKMCSIVYRVALINIWDTRVCKVGSNGVECKVN